MLTLKIFRRFVFVTLACFVSSAAMGEPVTFTSKRLCVEGVEKPLQVEVAETRTQRNRGLMQRESLAEDAGMLFLYDRAPPRGAGFYMYRTLIPLDIAFVDADDHIVAILTMTPCPHDDPRRCKVYRPGRAFVSALEVNAGFFERHGVEKGDRLFDPVEGRCDLAPEDAPITDSD